MKELCSQRIFLDDLIDSNQVMQSMWQTGATNARFEFSGEARFQIFIQKWLLGTLNIS